ncbi:MAG TPA: ATP-binding cassette domain-containing protein [Puia sp.]|jgi:ABC-2 type transport system ATP-binding protein|nr:ATP-binding cassette domain-containing protein [Puia sp.]
MVTIQNLHFAYRRRKIFNGLSLELKPGTIYGLLGRNGTGKSTLLRNIGGFLFPQQGSIDAFGFAPEKRQPPFLEKVVLLPEDFQLPPIGLQRWIKHMAPFYSLFDKRQFERYIGEFDVRPDATLNEMSYGQQKKVLISWALATNAPLLLLDEPTNGLDIVSKSQFRKVIAGAIDENRSILISTHQVKDLEQLIDRIMIIDEGRIIFDQDLESIASKLLFKFSFDPEEAARALYRESSLKGNALILRNTDREDSRPDLEMLYKAISLDPKTINSIFRP